MKKYGLEKDWSDVGIENEFMFCKVFQKKHLCKKLLECIFPDMVINDIDFPQSEKLIEADKYAKGVRLDIFVTDDHDNIYDIEMQIAVNTKELSKRTRYYQSSIDSTILDKGEIYSDLKETFIIMICLQDPFGKGRHQYTFHNTCKEDPDVMLEDKATKIFLNADGTMNDINPDLKAFLDYVAQNTVNDDFTNDLEKEVEIARNNKEWRRIYMTLEMRDLENQAIGREEGYLEGYQEGLQISIHSYISLCRECGFSEKEILSKIQSDYKLSEKEVEDILLHEDH